MNEAVRRKPRRDGLVNRSRVRDWLEDHVGGTQRECAISLGLSEMAVGRHVRALRSEWYDRWRSDMERKGMIEKESERGD